MAFYEHTFIARPDLSGTQAQSLAEELAKLVADGRAVAPGGIRFDATYALAG